MLLRTRGLAAVAAAASAALILAGCSSSSSAGNNTSSAAVTGGTFSIAIENPETLVPSNCYDLYCTQVLQTLDTGLFYFKTQSDGSVTPELTQLAKSVTASNGGKTYTIEINPGWTFTNGEAVTAKTFVDTFNFAALGTNGQQLGGVVFGPAQLNVVGYEAVSDPTAPKAKTMSGLKLLTDTTFSLTLVAPLGQQLFENYLGGPQILPMPSTALTVEGATAFGKQPIGNGPYMMTTPWTPNQLVTLVKNPNYKGTPGNADTIKFKIYNNDSAEWADLQANNLDIIPVMPQVSLSTASNVLGDRYVNKPGAASFGYYAFPLQTNTFKNKDVRIAISKAINWPDIIKKLSYETQTAAKSFAPSTIPGGGTDACGDSCVFDPAKAKALLAGAGGIPGNAVQIAGAQGSPNLTSKAACNQIQANLGVTCTLKLFPDFGTEAAAFKKLGPSDTGLIISLGWGSDNPTLANMIAPLFTTGSPSNDIGYSNPQFDKLIAEGNAASDSATQVSDWQQAQKVLYDDFVAYATTLDNNKYGYSTNVTNVVQNPQLYIDLSQVQVTGS